MGIIRTGHGLWSELVNRAALDLRRYDRHVGLDFRKHLKLPDGGSIAERLKEQGVRPEPVLGGFFNSLQPFTRMFRDILDMVEWAGKREGKENLVVEFDFEAGKEFKLDLKNFREQVERLSMAIRPLVIDRWNSNRLGSLAGALGDYVGEPRDVGVERWSEEYRGGRWPKNDLAPPRFDDPELAELMGRAWQVRRATIEAAREFSPNPADLSRITDFTAGDVVLENGVVARSHGALQTLAYLHGDHWAEGIAVKAYARAREVASDPSLADHLKGELRAVLDDPPPVRRDAKQAVREIEELLKLPVWQRRYDLYSVWVLTRIVEAMGGPARFRFELQGDAFHIPFKATLLATAQDLVPPVRVWGEVRSALSAPTGKGRSGGMQPDYSLTLDTREPPEEAFALVECKQYLRSSSGNFGAALTDYAAGQPGADVLLVNYGPVGSSVLKRIPARLLPRVKAIGGFRPFQPDSAREFNEWVRAQVEKHTAPAVEEAPAPAPAAGEDEAAFSGVILASIELRWGAEPRDLDLYLYVPTSGGVRESVNFNSPGALDARPWARLNEDVRNGSGPEIIEVSRALPGLYSVVVGLFSHDAPLAGSDATLTIQLGGGDTRRFVCPASGDGDYWHVCDVNFLAPLVTEVNLISRSPV